MRENGEAKLAVKNLHTHYLKDMDCPTLADKISDRGIATGRCPQEGEEIKPEPRKTAAAQTSKWWDKQ